VRTRIVASAAIALLWFFALGMFVHAQDQPAKVAGNWGMVLISPQGMQILFALVIEQDVTKIKGKMNSEFTGDSVIEGTINGNALTFQCTLAGPDGDLASAFKGTISGDTIDGTATIGQYKELVWTANRHK
jgi:hypothetical protein